VAVLLVLGLLLAYREFMTKAFFVLLLSSWTVLVYSNPYAVAFVLGLSLALMTAFVASIRKYLSIVFFLVYIGGLMILVSYCVMLLPIVKFRFGFFFFPLAGFWGAIAFPVGSSYSYGLLLSRAVLLVGLILFLVMLSVVELVDYSRGNIKLYD